MEYRFNKEKDRISMLVGNPYFFKATYRSQDGEIIEKLLWSPTSASSHVQTIACNFTPENYKLSTVKTISKEVFIHWLTSEIEINESIPKDFILDYCIALDHPGPLSTQRKGIYGDLSEIKNLLLIRDIDFINQLSQSYQLSLPENDIVREELDIEK